MFIISSSKFEVSRSQIPCDCLNVYEDEKWLTFYVRQQENVTSSLKRKAPLQYGTLKGTGHVTVNKPVISIIYIVVHTWPLCSGQILVDGVNPLESYLQISTNISAIVQHMSVSFVSLRSSRVHLQNNTFILRKAVKVSVIWPIKSTAKSSF